MISDKKDPKEFGGASLLDFGIRNSLIRGRYQRHWMHSIQPLADRAAMGYEVPMIKIVVITLGCCYIKHIGTGNPKVQQVTKSFPASQFGIAQNSDDGHS